MPAETRNRGLTLPRGGLLGFCCARAGVGTGKDGGGGVGGVVRTPGGVREPGSTRGTPGCLGSRRAGPGGGSDQGARFSSAGAASPAPPGAAIALCPAAERGLPRRGLGDRPQESPLASRSPRPGAHFLVREPQTCRLARLSRPPRPRPRRAAAGTRTLRSSPASLPLLCPAAGPRRRGWGAR